VLMSEMFSMSAKSPAVSAATAMLFLSGELLSTAGARLLRTCTMPRSIRNLALALPSLSECTRCTASGWFGKLLPLLRRGCRGPDVLVSPKLARL
jgi:hypothetical protein